MKYSIWGTIVRSALLVIILIVVIFAMKSLSTKGVNKDIFFLSDSPKTEAEQKTLSVVNFDLCQTRVESIYFKNGQKEYNLRIDGKSWKANTKDLPSVQMEKWLVLLCRVKPELMINLERSTQKFTFPDTLKFHYVNGQDLEFKLEHQAFKFGDTAFYSKTFLEMVNNLITMLASP